jgi:hypothetical protein
MELVMALPIADGQLIRPVPPRVADVDLQRVFLELVQKIAELQDLVRQLAARSP